MFSSNHDHLLVMYVDSSSNYFIPVVGNFELVNTA